MRCNDPAAVQADPLLEHAYPDEQTVPFAPLPDGDGSVLQRVVECPDCGQVAHQHVDAGDA